MHDLEERVGRYIIRLTDGIVLVLSMLVALWLHERLSGVVPWLRDLAPWHHYTLVFVLGTPVWLLALIATRADRFLSEMPSTGRLLRDLLRAQAISAVLLVAVLWFGKIVVNRGAILLYFVVQLAALSAIRITLVKWRRHRARGGHAREKVLVFGDAQSVDAARTRLVGSSNPPSIVPPPADAGEPILALAQALHDQAVDRVVLMAPYTTINNSREVVELCEARGIPVIFSLPVDELGERTARMVDVHGAPGLVYAYREKHSVGLAVKQVVDVVGTLLGLVILSPVFLLVMTALLLSDGRPLFFSQERIGLRGRRFQMLKFRTMVKDAEKRKAELTERNEAGGPVFKVKGDPRITKLGHFLRRSSIDELPQLLNVLAGDMSLVGPRPLPSGEQQQIHGPLRRRLAMKPGITGLWQVSGRSQITFERWMELDLRYVDTWSLLLDVKILLRTIPAVLFGSGAH